MGTTTPPKPEMPELSEAELDLLFRAAQEAPVLPSGDVMASILAQAEALQPKAVAHTVEEPGLFAQLWSMIGGWPTAAGLASATVAGLMIGISPPELVDSFSAGLFTSPDDYLVDLIPGFDTTFGEG